jgi:hypothetical protein
VWSPAPLLVAAVSVACLIAMPHTPARLVSFESSAPSPSATAAISAGDFEASQMSQMGARVVPTKLQIIADNVRPALNNSIAGAATSATRNSFKTRNKPEVIPARGLQRRATAPTLVRASMTGAGVDLQPLYLVQTEVVQTRQYDAAGGVVWDLCVWRVTVVGPVRNKMEAGIVAKSI